MRITIGKALKPWGLKGEVKVEPLTDFPERFKGLGRVYLASAGGKEIACTVKSVTYRGGAPYILFEGYDTPEKARALCNMHILIPREEAVPLPEGRYYWFDIIGLEVFSESGERLGKITDIFQTGSNDVYVMKLGRKEVYIPAIADVVKQIDLKAGRMIIHVMEGLME